jgi:Domain of unknown function (DUF927)
MEKKAVSVKDLIRVVSIIHDIDVGKYFIEVEFRSVEGKLERTTLQRGLTGPRALEELLMEGAAIPSGTAKELFDVLSAESDQVRRVTSRTGWHGLSFVLPDMTIGLGAETLEYRQREAAQQEQQVGGMLGSKLINFAAEAEQS